jgi:hypothetical protein
MVSKQHDGFVLFQIQACPPSLAPANPERTSSYYIFGGLLHFRRLGFLIFWAIARGTARFLSSIRLKSWQSLCNERALHDILRNNDGEAFRVNSLKRLRVALGRKKI